MKKLFAFGLTLVLAICLAQPAQSKIGIKGGINVSSVNAEGIRNYYGYQAGLAFQFDLPAWFTLEPDILFHMKGARIDQTSSMGLGYVEVPLNIQWGPRLANGNIRIFGQASPFIGYAVSKNVKDASGQPYEWNNVNRFEYGIGAGGGVQLWKIQVTALYNWNLGKIANSNLADQSFNEIFSDKNFDGFTITLGIIF